MTNQTVCQVPDDSNNNTATSTDYFAAVFESRVSKISAVSFSAVAGLILLPLVYVIIWFERFGSNLKRTFLNKMVSALCWTCFEWFFIVQIIDMIRYLSGPLPNFICFAQLHIKNAIFTQQLLILDTIAIGRYVFVFHLKNPAAFNDDFWCIMVNSWIFVLSIILQIVSALTPGRNTVYYYICSGKNPAQDQNIPLKNHSYMIALFAVTGLLHVVIALRIYFYKRKTKLDHLDLADSILKNKPSVTLSDLAINACLVTVAFAMLFIIYELNTIKVKDLNCYPNYLFEYFFRMAMPHIFSLAVVLMYYYRHPKLRSTLVSLLRDGYNFFVS